MLTPQSIEASTQKLMGNGGSGHDKNEPQKSFARYHHATSLRAASGGDLQVKCEQAPLKEAAKCDRDGRRDCPSGTASAQCTRVPRMDLASF